MPEDNFVRALKLKMHNLTKLVYILSKCFPKEELFAASSQLRRAALSIILNFIEGYARKRRAVKLNFWEISYGSLKETQYLLYFAYTEHWITHASYKEANNQCDEVGAMLWHAIESIETES